MAGVNLDIIVVHKNGTGEYLISTTSTTFQDLLNVVQTGSTIKGEVQKLSGNNGTGDEVGFSLTEGGSAVDLNASINTTVGGYDTTIYALYPEPSAETVTGFYLDGTEYKLGGGVTSVNGQIGDVTVSEFNATAGGTKVFAYPSVNTNISDILSWLNGGGDVILKLSGSHQTNWYYRVTKINGDSSYIVAESMEGTNETVNAKEIFYNSSNVVTSITDVSKNFFIPSNSGTQGQVLTKGASGYSWAAVIGGDVLVSSQANNILTSGMKIWAGTQANYDNLSSYDNNTIYLTIE